MSASFDSQLSLYAAEINSNMNQNIIANATDKAGNSATKTFYYTTITSPPNINYFNIELFNYIYGITI